MKLQVFEKETQALKEALSDAMGIDKELPDHQDAYHGFEDGLKDHREQIAQQV